MTQKLDWKLRPDRAWSASEVHAPPPSEDWRKNRLVFSAQVNQALQLNERFHTIIQHRSNHCRQTAGSHITVGFFCKCTNYEWSQLVSSDWFESLESDSKRHKFTWPKWGHPVLVWTPAGLWPRGVITAPHSGFICCSQRSWIMLYNVVNNVWYMRVLYIISEKNHSFEKY